MTPERAQSLAFSPPGFWGSPALFCPQCGVNETADSRRQKKARRSAPAGFASIRQKN
jgi:hypothetical protein